MRNVILRIRAAIRYYKALSLRAESEVSAALKLVADLGPGLPTHFRVRVLLLKGLLYTSEKEYEAAYESLLQAFNDATDIRKYFSKQDISYMRSVASEIGIMLARKLGKSTNPFQLYYDEIELDQISRHLIRYFPLTDHPNWQKSP